MARLDAACGSSALIAAMRRRPGAPLGDVQPLRDLAAARAFVAGKGLVSFLDLPFVPFFVAILYLVHPLLFLLTVAGALVLVVLAYMNQWFSHRSATAASKAQGAALLSAQAFVRNGESLGAMGMVDEAFSKWGSMNLEVLSAQDRLARINAVFAGLSRSMRLGLQIAILGYGGYLVLAGQMTAGMIFAASLISGRALQPIDQVIAGWRGFVETQKAWIRLGEALDAVKPSTNATRMPTPRGHISLENVSVTAPYATTPELLLKRISAEIREGDSLAVIGPSGAGKSTLLRAIVGAVPLHSGAVRIDGCDIRNWDRSDLGRSIGYLAQETDLIPGTIAENIARFDPDADDAEIVEAGRRAQAHDLILRLPQGYDTVVGPGGLQLSGGERQRIGLARAFFGSPRIILLDEPNASLDHDGDVALRKALCDARDRNVTIVVVTQRRQITEVVEKMMVVRDGMLDDFGSVSDVLARQGLKTQSLAEVRQVRTDPASSVRQRGKLAGDPRSADRPAHETEYRRSVA